MNYKIEEELGNAYLEKYGADSLNFMTDQVIKYLSDIGKTALVKTVLAKELFIVTTMMVEFLNYTAWSNDQILLMDYIHKLNDMINGVGNNVLVVSFAHNTNHAVSPSRHVRLGFDNIRNVSMLYDYNKKHGLEFFIPQGAKAFGNVEYQNAVTMENEVLGKIMGEYGWFTKYFWNF